MSDPQIDEVSIVAETNDTAPGSIPVSEVEVDVTLLTDEQREGYEKTLEISRKAAPILAKIAEGAFETAHAPSIRLKAQDCWDFMTWITTIQNIADMQQQKIDAMEAVISSQYAALKKYKAKTGKDLWTPGPVR